MVKLGSGSHLHGQPWLQRLEVAEALGCQSPASAGHQRGPQQSQACFWDEQDHFLLVQVPSIWLSNCYPDPLQWCEAPTSNSGLTVLGSEMLPPACGICVSIPRWL